MVVDMCFNINISSNLAKSKNSPFFGIFCVPPKKIQVATNRTVLKLDALPIAHFEASVPDCSKHMLKLAIPLKIWVADPQGRLIRIRVPQKNSFWTKVLTPPNKFETVGRQIFL